MEEISNLNEVFRYLSNDNILERISKITNDSDIDVKEMSSRLLKELTERKKQLENIKEKIISVNKALKDSTSGELLAKIDDEISSIDKISDSLNSMINGDIPFSQSNLLQTGEEVNKLFDLEASLQNTVESSTNEYKDYITKMVENDPSKLEELRDLANRQQVDDQLEEDIEDTIEAVEESKDDNVVEISEDEVVVTDTQSDGATDIEAEEEFIVVDETPNSEGNNDTTEDTTDADEQVEEDLEEEIIIDNANNEQIDVIENRENGVEENTENLAKDNAGQQVRQPISTEQNSMKNKKGKNNLSYSERVRNINYRQGMNYSEEVHKIRVEYEIELIESRLNLVNKEIKKLKDSNKKVPFKLAVQQQQLLNQINELKNETQLIELNRKENKREEKLSKTQAKIDQQVGKLTDEMIIQNEVKSKLFKGMSLRREKKIREKLLELNGKMNVVKQEQITSTEMKFDIRNKKLIKLAKKNAKKQVIQQKIEELKSYRDKLVDEAMALGHDISRFVSKSELIQKLKQSTVQFTGNPVIIDMPEEELETSMVRAA